MKTCNQCKELKPCSSFHVERDKKDGLRTICKQCTSANQKKYREANPEKLAAQSSARYFKNAEKIKARHKAWEAANPEKRSAITHKRRARQAGSGGGYSDSDISFILSSQGFMCASCSQKLILSGRGKYHVDHIVPISKGGSNEKYNLQCLCPTCNKRKHAKDPIAWAQENGKLL